jgi:hypothetical protein
VALSSPKISLQLSNVHNDDWLARLMLLVCETAQPGIEPGLIGELKYDLRATGNLGCKRRMFHRVTVELHAQLSIQFLEPRHLAFLILNPST